MCREIWRAQGRYVWRYKLWTAFHVIVSMLKIILWVASEGNGRWVEAQQELGERWINRAELRMDQRCKSVIGEATDENVAVVQVGYDEDMYKFLYFSVRFMLCLNRTSKSSYYKSPAHHYGQWSVRILPCPAQRHCVYYPSTVPQLSYVDWSPRLYQ